MPENELPSARDEAEEENTDEPNQKKSKLEELHQFLDEKEEVSGKQNFSTAADILTEIKREMTIFENTGERPAILEKLFRAIQSLPPTSVEAERAFSAAGMFITKLRSSLSDNSIDKLCFLRKFLLKH